MIRLLSHRRLARESKGGGCAMASGTRSHDRAYGRYGFFPVAGLCITNRRLARESKGGGCAMASETRSHDRAYVLGWLSNPNAQ